MEFRQYLKLFTENKENKTQSIFCNLLYELHKASLKSFCPLFDCGDEFECVKEEIAPKLNSWSRHPWIYHCNQAFTVTNGCFTLLPQSSAELFQIQLRT